MHSKLDLYFKEQIDNQVELDVVLDEDGYVDYMIDKRDAIDAVNYSSDEDETMCDNDDVLSDIEDDELDSLVNDDDSYIDTIVE